MQNSKTFGKEWEKYRCMVIPEDAPQIQMEECKLAFYAGAMGCINLLSAIDGTISEAEGIGIIAGIEKEILRFVAEQAGKRNMSVIIEAGVENE